MKNREDCKEKIKGAPVKHGQNISPGPDNSRVLIPAVEIGKTAPHHPGDVMVPFSLLFFGHLLPGDRVPPEAPVRLLLFPLDHPLGCQLCHALGHLQHIVSRVVHLLLHLAAQAFGVALLKLKNRLAYLHELHAQFMLKLLLHLLRSIH